MKKQTPNKLNEIAGRVAPAAAASSCPAPNPTADIRPPTPLEEGLITKHELARRLHKTPRTVERWQRRGIIPYIKCGRAVYYHWYTVIGHIADRFRVCKQQQPLRIPIIGIAGDVPPKKGQS